MQYTLRGIPAELDEALRARARTKGKSLNDMAIQALLEGVGLGETLLVRRDLDDIAGTWKSDATFDAVLREQDCVDEGLWK